MPLQVGARLGHYTVTAKLGEGGMGEVWRATDTKLNRQVALKILPEAFAADPDRLARFQREAHVLASLNHPGIAAFYGIEEADDTRALVLELVEGPTLADRISKGAIPVDEALPIAKQIAEALEAAHEAGVIHRDLKPANTKVRNDGTVKVLDFGLAKAFQPEASDASASMSPTISLTAAATQIGMVIGTAAYMAPEQAKGKVVDKRVDVWAFGAVLYEMLTGRKMFEAVEVSEMLASVLLKDPDFSNVDDQVPAHLQSVLRRCLVKDPNERMRDIGEARIAFGQGSLNLPAHVSDAASPVGLRFWQRPVPAILAALALVGMTGLGGWGLRPSSVPEVSRFRIGLVEDANFLPTNRRRIALSPDGRRLVIVGADGLWLQPLDQLDAHPLTGTSGARSPFFSGDGQWIGFYSDGQLRRIAAAGGAPVSITETEMPLWGASWGPDDTILFGQGEQGIWQVPADGGVAERLIEAPEGQAAHDPHVLPGGDAVVFTLVAVSGTWGDATIVVHDLSTGQQSVLIEGGREARFVETGHIV